MLILVASHLITVSIIKYTRHTKRNTLPYLSSRRQTNFDLAVEGGGKRTVASPPQKKMARDCGSKTHIFIGLNNSIDVCSYLLSEHRVPTERPNKRTYRQTYVGKAGSPHFVRAVCRTYGRTLTSSRRVSMALIFVELFCY